MIAKPKHTKPVQLLNTLFTEDEDCGLHTLRMYASELMTEIEETAKEVKGDPFESSRYVVAAEIKMLVDQLERIRNGTYTYNLPSRDVAELPS